MRTGGRSAPNTLATGKVSVTGSSQVRGPAARGIGAALWAVAAALAGFALYVLPHLGRHH